MHDDERLERGRYHTLDDRHRSATEAGAEAGRMEVRTEARRLVNDLRSLPASPSAVAAVDVSGVNMIPLASRACRPCNVPQ